jgi:hypothetical protein
MIKIDAAYLEQLGLQTLPQQEANIFLQHVYETLEMRVGVSLADRMTDRQLNEFETYFDAGDDVGAFAWIAKNFPDHKAVVEREFAILTSEVQQAAPTILNVMRAE